MVGKVVVAMMSMVVVMTVVILMVVMMAMVIVIAVMMMIVRYFLLLSVCYELAIVINIVYVSLSPYCKHPRIAPYCGSKHCFCSETFKMYSLRFTFLGQLLRKSFFLQHSQSLG